MISIGYVAKVARKTPNGGNSGLFQDF